MPAKPKLQPTRPADMQYALLLAQRPRESFKREELYENLLRVGIDEPDKLIRAARKCRLLQFVNWKQGGPELLRFNDRALGFYPAPPYFEELRALAPKAEPAPPASATLKKPAPVYFPPAWPGLPHRRVATRVGYLRQETGKMHLLTLERLHRYLTGPADSELASFTKAARRLVGQPCYGAMIQHQDALAVGGAWLAEPDGQARAGLVLLHVRLAAASLTRERAQYALRADSYLHDALLLLYASPDERQLTLVLDTVETDYATAWQQHADYLDGRHSALGLRCVRPAGSPQPGELALVWYDPKAYCQAALRCAPPADDLATPATLAAGAPVVSPALT